MSHDVIAAVVAHPDDAELRCYGTLRKYAAEGYDCHVFVACSGEHGIYLSETINDKSLLNRNIRERETLSAFAGCDISIHFLGQADGNIGYGRDTICLIEAQLQMYSPVCVMTHYPDAWGADHQDHTALARSVLNCCTRLNSVKKILLCDPLKTIRSHFIPNYFVDITEYFDDKIEALAQQTSQLGRYYLQREFHMSKSDYYASNINYSVAQEGRKYEAFSLYFCCE